MKLYHNNVLIGEITAVETDMFWLSGIIHFTPEAATYEDFFAFITDEDNALEELPFASEMLENWFVEDENGKMRAIEIPAVHDDNTIDWRW